MPNKVEQVPITVAGNILSELSEKIPNNIIALNELIKNAYDACSPSVEITLDSESRLLTIRDYGIGMDTEGIKKLFHISSSDKKYGEIISYKDTERLTQGSKGLGFLSVFRFGKKVYWKTGKNSQIFEFGVDFENLKNEYNLPDHKLNIKISDQEFKGTQIVIDVDDYNLKSLKTTLANESSRKKILNSFVSSKVSDEGIKIDKEFIISLTLDDNKYSSDVNLDISHQGKKDHQLFRIKYSSKDKKINYYKNSILIYSSDFEYSFDDYIVDIDLMAFDFGQGRSGKDKINSVFYKPQTTNDITPLVFINNNLFNNYHLFDTEIMARKRSSLVLRQLVGYISIKSSSQLMQFNSDRTQFSQNRLTDEITDFIKNLNEEIQRTGSSLRSEIKNIKAAFTQTKILEEDIPVLKNNQKYIIPNFKLKDFIIFEKQRNKLKCTLFDKEILLDIIPKTKETINLGIVESWIDIDDLGKEISNLNELIQVATDIYFNEEKVSEFNKLQEGEWVISQETDTAVSSLKIILRKPAQPKISQKENILKKGIDYKVDDLFNFINSFGEEDKGLLFEIDTKNNPTINFNKGIISFGRLNENTISIKITDKKTRLIHEADFTFRVVEDNFYIAQPESSSSNLVSMPINKEVNFRSDVVSFIGEINRIFSTEEYSFVAVAAYRTLIEIVVNDILDNSKIGKTESLLQNYRKVIEEGKDLIDSSELDDADKRVLNSLRITISSRDESESFLAFLNLSTHGGTRIITKADVMKKTQEIKLLLGLLYISSLDKER